MSTVIQRAPARISDTKIARGGLVVGACIFAGQLLGFVRQAAIAYLLGTGPEADALSVALAPVDLWWAVLTTTIVFGFGPMFAGEQKAPVFGDLARPVVWASAAASALFVVFAGPIVTLSAPGLTPDTAERAAQLARILALALPAVSFSTLFTALLYMERRFVFATLHRGAVNAATIAGAFVLHKAVGFAIGYAAGAWIQLGAAALVCRPLSQRRTSGRSSRGPRAVWSSPAHVLGYALLVGLNPVFTRALASTFGPGGTATFDYCLKLTGVPLALLVNSISSSMLSEVAPFRYRGDRGIAVRSILKAAGATALFSAALTAAVLSCAPWMVSLLFERGEFRGDSTSMVSSMLYGFYPVLIAWSLLDVVSRSMFALGKPKAPLVAAACGLAVNTALALAAPIPSIGWVGIPAIAGFLAAAVMAMVSLVRISTREDAAR